MEGHIKIPWPNGIVFIKELPDGGDGTNEPGGRGGGGDGGHRDGGGGGGCLGGDGGGGDNIE